MRDPVWVLSASPVVSTPPFGPWTFWQRWLIGQELRHDAGTPPPPSGFASWLAYYLQVVKGELPVTTFETPTTVVRGRKLSVIFTRTGEDVATIGVHFLHRDGDEAVNFTDDDSASVESHFNGIWHDNLRGLYTSDFVLDRYVWHRFGVDVRKPNPAARELVITSPEPGTITDGQQLPQQTACSVTFKTSVRRNWGRVYLPALAGSALASEGRFDDDVVDSIRGAFGTLADQCASDHLPMVVWCPRHDGKLLQFFKRDADHPSSAYELDLDLPDSTSFARTVDQVQVDDIPDVIRSRRIAKALHYATHSVT